jgi:hypothetical protein
MQKKSQSCVPLRGDMNTRTGNQHSNGHVYSRERHLEEVYAQATIYAFMAKPGRLLAA